MNDTKITKERVKHHFLYSWWKYALLAAFALVGWNMVYTMTEYQAPPDKRLGVYFVTHSVDGAALELLQDQILMQVPWLEEAVCVSIAYTEDDNYYASIQLSTYIGAGEGDIYIMNRQQFNQYAPNGMFLALDALFETGELDAGGLNMENGYAASEDTGQKALYGIPASELYGMMDYGIDNRDLLICVMAYSKSTEAAVQCVNWFIETMNAPKPEWVTQLEAEQNIVDSAELYPSY